MNLANKITLIRILMIPAFMIVILSDIPNNIYIAALIFFIASITDILDGYVARWQKQITDLGKFIDPLADKLLITTALVSLVELGEISSIIAMIIISRELIITGFRAIAASRGVIVAASSWGKVKTVTQIIAIMSILLRNFPFSMINFPFDKIMTYIAVVFTIVSAVDYFIKNKQVFHIEQKR
ncbi:MAG: CDP-diacylglycerol--glycerol-3-phosphate 3-phosphatidyltransferase [Clostridia bacterium]|nr:CDP-diacylglycerol--glycerol-3-phosphate 3-phosphatidyltransferase [Clostridia bacterium]